MKPESGRVRAGLRRRVRADVECRSTRRALLRSAMALPAFAFGFLALPLAAVAQQPRIFRVGVIAGPQQRDAFRQGLLEHGWIDGKNIVVEYRTTDASPERRADVARELSGLKVDCIVAQGNLTISTLKQVTSGIPIVMAGTADAVGSGLVENLRRPETAFAAMVREKVEGLLVPQSPVAISARARIVSLAAKGRLPAVYQNSSWVEEGGVMSYGPGEIDPWRRSAGYVDKILKGAKPADIPVEQPTKFELVVNLKTAIALGITIPQAFLATADRVIE